MSLEEPPSKRKRTDATDEPLITRSKYWLEDGNVVLQAENTQFRVHRSMLSRHSEIFKDMFSIPQSSQIVEPVVEGCSVVVLSDKAEDVENLMSIYYDNIRIHDLRNPLPFDQVVAMFRLGKKYEIEYLRAEAIARFRDTYPKCLHRWSLSNRRGHLIKKRLTTRFDAVIIAHEFSLFSIMPTVCIEYMIHTPLEKIISDDLPPEMRKRIIVARDRFTYRVREKLVRCLVDSSPPIPARGCMGSKDCSNLGPAIMSNLTLWDVDDGHMQAMNSEPWLFNDATKALCDTCRRSLRKYVDEVRRELWDEIPALFGFSGWQGLEKLDES